MNVEIDVVRMLCRNRQKGEKESEDEEHGGNVQRVCLRPENGAIYKPSITIIMKEEAEELEREHELVFGF